MSPSEKSTGMWNRAKELAEQTPPDRNRYVDLLRALAISSVVLGHWIMAAPYFTGNAQMAHLLDVQPWSRWLTWLFQVMPVFFFVGGFSNGVSWDGAVRKKQSYAAWLELRMRRLLGPAIPLVMLWAVLGIIGFHTGVHPQMIKIGSQVSLVPVWFLAIYFVIVLLVPVTRKLWQRYGMASVVVPLLLAVVGDLIFFNTEHKWFGWFNYLFVWGAVHQLGYAWQQGKLGGVASSLLMAISGLLILICLTQFGPYPTSLVGVPSQELSNTTPPKLPLVALGLTQIGFLLSLEGPMRRWLSRGRVWTATVLTNGFIMPVFLWHSTVMMLTIGFGFLVLPDLFAAFPGTAQWWSLRPAWVLIYSLLLFAGLPLFVYLERVASRTGSNTVPLWALTVGGLLIGGGLAMLAGGGVSGAQLWGLNWLAVGLPILGASIVAISAR